MAAAAGGVGDDDVTADDGGWTVSLAGDSECRSTTTAGQLSTAGFGGDI